MLVYHRFYLKSFSETIDKFTETNIRFTFDSSGEKVLNCIQKFVQDVKELEPKKTLFGDYYPKLCINYEHRVTHNCMDFVLVRKKKRWIFVFDPYWDIVLTEVVQNNRVLYEIEIEHTGSGNFISFNSAVLFVLRNLNGNSEVI